MIALVLASVVSRACDVVKLCQALWVRCSQALWVRFSNFGRKEINGKHTPWFYIRP